MFASKATCHPPAGGRKRGIVLHRATTVRPAGYGGRFAALLAGRRARKSPRAARRARPCRAVLRGRLLPPPPQGLRTAGRSSTSAQRSATLGHGGHSAPE